jgi:HK97 family phage portal protein
MSWNPFATAAAWLQNNGYYRMAAVMGWGGTADSGEKVDMQTMLTLSTVWACSKVLSESMASLPCHLYEETKSGREKRVDDPIYALLHDQFNPYIPAGQGRESVTLWGVNAGNGIARIEWRNDSPVAMWPLHPSEVDIERIPRGIRYYERQPNGTRDEIPTMEVFHIPNMTSDGYVGMGVVDFAKNVIGNGLAAQKYAGKFFSNGGRVPGIIKVGQTFKDDEKRKEFRESFEKVYGGADNSHKNMLLEGEVDFKPLGISPKDAQFVEWSAFGVPDVCRFYRVPPHMVMDLSRATFSNIEHQGIEYVNYTLMPWIVRWEQQIQMRLINYNLAANIGKPRRYAKFNVNALMRGDFLSRMQGLTQALQNGMTNIDEARALEDWNVLPNNSGKAHYIQLNMQTVPGSGQPTASELATLAKINAAPPAPASIEG